MSFSIIIPSRNVENLTACVRAIRAAGEGAQIIVVWDGFGGFHRASSVEELWKVKNALNKLGEDRRAVVFNGDNPFCFAHNINIGIRAAGIDDAFLWNDDALLEAPVYSYPLTDMVRAIEYSQFETGAPWGVVSCAVAGHAGPAFPSAKTRMDDLWQSISKSLWPVRQPLGCKMVPFTAVYIPRRVIDAVGLLDERFTGEINGEPVYGGEDDAYCYECRKRGFSIGVFDGAVVNHAALPSTFRPDGKGRSIEGARMRFQEIYGLQMGTR